MKINDIFESTTSGSVATVAMPMGGTQKREGTLFKGKKTKKKFYESEVNEAEVNETDLILVPGQGKKLKPGFIPKDQDRRDHEVEMARSDLFHAAQNAKEVYKMIQQVSEDEGLEGWVQEKIIKANDYLNTVREYLEHKTYMQEGGVIAGGMSNFEENKERVDSLVTNALKRMEGPSIHDAVKALIVEIGTQEFKSRLQFYKFYVNQLVQMYEKQGVAEGSEQEGSTFKNSLRTIIRVATHLEKQMGDDENFPEWESEMVGSVKDQIVRIMDYEISKKEQQGVAEGDYADGSSIKTPGSEDWKQQYQQAVMAVKNAKTQQEYEAASDRAGRIKDLLASKGIQVGAVLGQQGVAEGSYQSQYKSKEEAIQYAKQKVKTFRDPDDRIEIWSMPDGGFDVVHNMNSNGRNHCIDNGGKKLGTISPRQQGAAEDQVDEEKDACYNKVKSRYKVWPSAYASGALVKCRKVGASNWGNSSKK